MEKATPVAANGPDLDIDAFIREYIGRWNARDAAAIWTGIYRLDTGHSLQSQADLQRLLAGLDGEGFDHTEILDIVGRRIGPDEAVAMLRYSRFRKDGSPMPPAERDATYWIRRFDDGWRMTQITNGRGA